MPKSLQMRICLKILRVKLKKSLQMSICLQILRVSYLQSFCNLPKLVQLDRFDSGVFSAAGHSVEQCSE